MNEFSSLIHGEYPVEADNTVNNRAYNDNFRPVSHIGANFHRKIFFYRLLIALLEFSKDFFIFIAYCFLALLCIFVYSSRKKKWRHSWMYLDIFEKYEIDLTADVIAVALNRLSIVFYHYIILFFHFISRFILQE